MLGVSEENCITLFQGDWFFGSGKVKVKTLLGSCISIVIWHPQRKIGGMCHYLLPASSAVGHRMGDGRYAADVKRYYSKKMTELGVNASEFVAHLYGGTNMFLSHRGECIDAGKQNDFHCRGCHDVSCQNRTAALELAQIMGFQVVSVDLGGDHYRTLEFNVFSGSVRVERFPIVGEFDCEKRLCV